MSKSRIIKSEQSDGKTVRSYIDASKEFKSEKDRHDVFGIEFGGALSEDAKLKSIERKAYERGFEQGEKAGYTLEEKKLEPVLDSLSSLLEDLSSRYSKWVKENEKAIVDLALIIATKIIQEEIKQNRDVVLRLAHDVINRTIKGSKATLRVSPQDLTYLEQHLKDFPDFARSEHFTIEADSEITRGGCVLISDAGEIDATVENQIRIMREKLLSDIE